MHHIKKNVIHGDFLLMIYANKLQLKIKLEFIQKLTLVEILLQLIIF